MTCRRYDWNENVRIAIRMYTRHPHHVSNVLNVEYYLISKYHTFVHQVTSFLKCLLVPLYPETVIAGYSGSRGFWIRQSNLSLCHIHLIPKYFNIIKPHKNGALRSEDLKTTVTSAKCYSARKAEAPPPSQPSSGLPKPHRPMTSQRRHDGNRERTDRHPNR